jgi:putative DNA primase/helicase
MNPPSSSANAWLTAEISMVASAKSIKTSRTTVAAVLRAIASGRWANEVNPIAAGYTKAIEAAQREGKADPVAAAKEAVREAKLRLPGILFSGRFERRAADAIQTHSGLLCLDMDNCAAPAELRAKIGADDYVQAAFISPTGSGLKVLVRVKADASVHVASFAAARKHFGEAYGVSVDEACKDASRICFVADDPDAFIREKDAEILEPLPAEQEEQQPPPKPEPEAETYESLPRPCYRVYHAPWKCGDKWYPPGTWLHDRTAAKNGEIVDQDYRLCAPLEVLGKSSTRDLEHGRLVEFVSSNHTTKRHIVPMRLLAGRGDEALGELMSLGLETVRRHHSDILVYVQESHPKERWTAALSTGWQHDDAFVLPDEIITPAGSDYKIWYGGRDSESPYRRAGTLKDWQEKVAALAPGNPNLVGAICAAFAGPLLCKFGVPGALLHLFGRSSTGKTTTLAAAASAWGGGTADGRNQYIRSWQATTVGVEAIASLHSDTLAVLDELHLCDPKVLDPVIYAFANGTGKSRGNVHASLRPTKHWRVLGLSSGEVSCATWLRTAGFTVRSGQSVRMLDIPVQGEFGAFDDLHGGDSASEFAHTLFRSTLTHYGHAGPAFVQALIEENPDLDEHLATALGNFHHSDNVQARAARIFAILAVAGALARRYGIVPWPDEHEPIKACVTLYNRWKEQLIASGAETSAARICQQVATFISRYGDSRFSDIEGGDSDEPRVNDRAGYWKQMVGGPRLYLLRSDALQDAARGHDLSEIGNALNSAGALYRVGGDGRHLTVVTRTPRGNDDRFYYVNPEKLDLQTAEK